MRWWIGAAVAVLMLGLLWFWRGSRSSSEMIAVEKPAASAPPRTSPPLVVSPTPAVGVITPPKKPAASHVLVRAGWGAGAGQLGKKIDQESAPEGPMSLTVDGRGNLYVLDEVNRRVQRWSADGKPLAPISIGSDTVQDLALGKNGAVALLDRLGEKNLQLYGSDGKPLGDVPLQGKHLPEAGGTTGLFTDKDGNFWVEREHAQLVRVATADGHSDPERPTAPGRPSRDGRLYLSASIADRASGAALVRGLAEDGRVLWHQLVSLGAPLLYLSLLDSDARGNVYVAGHTGRESAQPPYQIVGEKLVIVGLSSDGAPRGMMELPASPPLAESFRELTIGDDGTIYRMVFSDAGVVIETYRL
jgi:hypothetical protein